MDDFLVVFFFFSRLCRGSGFARGTSWVALISSTIFLVISFFSATSGVTGVRRRMILSSLLLRALN